MSEWRDCEVGDVITLQRGFDITRKEQRAGSYPVVSSSGTKSHHDQYKVEGPGVVIGRKGTLGTAFYVNENYWPHDTTLWVKDFKDNNPRFVYYFIQELELGLYDVGSSNPTLNRNHVHVLPARIPELPEQKAIADVLTSLDDKIDLLHRQNKTLEAMAETLFRQWFVEEADAKVKITHYVDFNPPRKLAKGTKAPYLDMGGVSTSTFNATGWYDREYKSGTKFQNGDSLLARITPCLENGKSAFVTFLQSDQVGWGSTEFIVMRSKVGIQPIFTYALARNQEFRDYAEGCMAGSSGRQRVDLKHLVQFEVNDLCDDELNAFNRSIETIPPKLHNNMLQMQTLERLRDTLLPKMMSGEVRVEL